MRNKVFISYRRQDSGANALGIGQYLEHEFGRKNVFIDVDMRAGTKFPKVLEQRLAECKVILVLIGPGWLNATDERGQRRLDDPDDWVRLEIAHALNRNITVIPVRVNGADLPSKGDLPHDIRGLLDHQAVSVTLASFRNEMSGLVRDIRAISKSSPWRRFAGVLTGVLALLIVFAFAQSIGFSNAIERIRFLLFSAMSASKNVNEVWGSKAGEWVMYESATPVIGEPSVSHYFKPLSVKIIGDRVAYEARYPLANAVAIDRPFAQGVYETVTNVIDCKRSIVGIAEKAVYNKANEAISNFKWGEPESLDLSVGVSIAPGSIFAAGQHIICNEQIRTPLLQNVKLPASDMKLLSRTPLGDGDIFYGPARNISNSTYELTSVIKSDIDHSLTELFPTAMTVVGLPSSFRVRSDLLQLSCTDRKIRDLKFELYDSQNNWLYISAPITVAPITATQGSPFDSLVAAVCGAPIPKVRGTYEGTNNMTYAKKGHGAQKISLSVEQVENDLNVSFVTAEGGQGKGTGKLIGAVVERLQLQNTSKDCPGSYQASLKFLDDTAIWSYKGEDCNGPVEGSGTAKKTKL